MSLGASLDAAKAADTVVMVMGLSPRLEGEEMRVPVEGYAGGDRVQIGIPRNRFKTTAGLDLTASDKVDIRVEYTGEFADHFHSNGAALKATYKF